MFEARGMSKPAEDKEASHIEGPKKVPEEMVRQILDKGEAKSREEAEKIAAQRLRAAVKKES